MGQGVHSQGFLSEMFFDQQELLFRIWIQSPNLNSVSQFEFSLQFEFILTIWIYFPFEFSLTICIQCPIWI